MQTDNLEEGDAILKDGDVRKWELKKIQGERRIQRSYGPIRIHPKEDLYIDKLKKAGPSREIPTNIEKVNWSCGALLLGKMNILKAVELWFRRMKNPPPQEWEREKTCPYVLRCVYRVPSIVECLKSKEMKKGILKTCL